MLALPDRSDWLDPDKECETETKAPSLSDIGVEVSLPPRVMVLILG